MQLGQGTLVAGRYVVEKKIGEGAWGEVWLGHHAAVGMKVALKSLRAQKAESHDAIVRFGREAKFLGRVQSDYVARVLDYIDDDVYGLVLVMEYIEGESLADVLEAGPISVERAIAVGRDVAAGLCDLHAARVVHRDLKPANVILRPLATGGERAVIIDFSLGRLMGRGGGEESSLTQLTGAAMSVGTLPYMAPEQILDSRKVTFASDVYALGSMLYRCVAGRYVFTEKEDAAVARRKLTAEPPPLELDRDDALARGLAAVVDRAIRRRPDDRWGDAREMLDALAAIQAPAPPPPEPPTARPSPALLAFAGVALLGAGAAAGFAFARNRTPAPVVVAPLAPSITIEPPRAQSVDTPPPTPAAVIVDDPIDAATEAAPEASARPPPPPRPTASAPPPKPSAPPSPYDEE